MGATGKGCGMGSCSCGCCHGGKMRLVFLLRVLVMLIILIIVFGAGFKLGSLKSSLVRGYYGSSMMMQRYGTVSGGQTGGMMPYRTGQQGTSTVN